MIREVTQFNRERNNFAWNMELELNMLREEIKEFWDATTVAERLDALVDTEYVWLGTQVKASFNTQLLPKELVDSIELSISLMLNYLQHELEDKFYVCHINAQRIVCKANGLKGSNLDKDGKVTKDQAYKVDATKEIALMIQEETKVKEY